MTKISIRPATFIGNLPKHTHVKKKKIRHCAQARASVVLAFHKGSYLVLAGHSQFSDNNYFRPASLRIISATAASTQHETPMLYHFWVFFWQLGSGLSSWNVEAKGAPWSCQISGTADPAGSTCTARDIRKKVHQHIPWNFYKPTSLLRTSFPRMKRSLHLPLPSITIHYHPLISITMHYHPFPTL